MKSETELSQFLRIFLLPTLQYNYFLTLLHSEGYNFGFSECNNG